MRMFGCRQVGGKGYSADPRGHVAEAKDQGARELARHGSGGQRQPDREEGGHGGRGGDGGGAGRGGRPERGCRARDRGEQPSFTWQTTIVDSENYPMVFIGTSHTYPPVTATPARHTHTFIPLLFVFLFRYFPLDPSLFNPVAYFSVAACSLRSTETQTRSGDGIICSLYLGPHYFIYGCKRSLI